MRFSIVRSVTNRRADGPCLGFKLPHDVVSTCAKRDEPPSRRTMLGLQASA
ncbi:MAG: hypothetical protein IKX30_16375 [Victivallales bacterium]|nr:hypothetical protein [Victivallales bacterium]